MIDYYLLFIVYCVKKNNCKNDLNAYSVKYIYKYNEL